MADRHAVLFSVGAAIRLENGTIVIDNARGGELLFVRSDGERIATVERVGEGPGEYRSIDQLTSISGREVVAFDGGLRRGLVFDSAGNHLRDFVIGPSTGEIRLVGFLPPDLFVAAHYSGYVQSPSDPRPEALTRSVSIVLHRPEVGSADTVTTILSGSSISRVGGPWGWIATPFGSRPVVGVSDDRIFVGDGERYEIKAYDRNGGLLRILENRKPRVEVTERMIQEYRDHVMDIQSNDPGRQAASEKAMESIPWPRFLPSFTTILADESGCLWVCEGTSPDEDRSCWNVYGPDGGSLGRVDVPSDLETVLQVGEDFLLGIRFEDQVPEVVVYDLDRSSMPR